MSWSFAAPTPLAYFEALVQSDAQFPLLEAAISLGQDDEPTLDVQQVLGEVDQLLAEVRVRIPGDAPAVYKLRILNQFFFKDRHFGGNLNDYYDPDNSYLHRLLQTRRGIPVSLAVLWLELAQGLGLAARGVGFPGHFLVKVNLPQGQVLIDPFTGESLSREDLSERLALYRGGPETEMDDAMTLSHFLQGATPREIIARMLRNLKEIHRERGDLKRLLAVQDRLLVLLPQAWPEYRDRGLARAELGLLAQAMHDLQLYLDHAEPAPDQADIAARLSALRQALG